MKSFLLLKSHIFIAHIACVASVSVWFGLVFDWFHIILYGTVNGELKFIQNRSKNRF